jgi:peptide deformylase
MSTTLKLLYRLFCLNVLGLYGIGEASVEQWRHIPAFSHLIHDRSQFFSTVVDNVITILPIMESGPIRSKKSEFSIDHPFRYSNNWTGTSLPLWELSTAVKHATQMSITIDGTQQQYRWEMGRWPDPILRRRANPVSLSLLGTDMLKQACEMLRNTAITEGAVGLAAQQCGINARIIYLEVPSHGRNSYIIMINPKIQNRSPESKMLVWRESCLVLPPTFQATVLRDAWVDVAYYDWKSKGLLHHNSITPPHAIRLYGQLARAVQHEMDHDQGILITDHVSLDELENDLMRSIERSGHENRMMTAYSRGVYSNAEYSITS